MNQLLDEENKGKSQIFGCSKCNYFFMYFFYDGWWMKVLWDMDERFKVDKKDRNFSSSVHVSFSRIFCSSTCKYFSLLDDSFLGDGWRFTWRWMNQLLDEEKKGWSFSYSIESFVVVDLTTSLCIFSVMDDGWRFCGVWMTCFK